MTTTEHTPTTHQMPRPITLDALAGLRDGAVVFYRQTSTGKESVMIRRRGMWEPAGIAKPVTDFALIEHPNAEDLQNVEFWVLSRPWAQTSTTPSGSAPTAASST
ncbi:MAG: hypothetical protein QJR09_11980 [Micrococcus sp.]|nr:hypothetical protein [Micrococcus sp.]